MHHSWCACRKTTSTETCSLPEGFCQQLWSLYGLTEPLAVCSGWNSVQNLNVAIKYQLLTEKNFSIDIKTLTICTLACMHAYTHTYQHAPIQRWHSISHFQHMKLENTEYPHLTSSHCRHCLLDNSRSQHNLYLNKSGRLCTTELILTHKIVILCYLSLMQ
jgi:hypothetical protein